ncbi:hypothetical protein AC579_1301 [Pseudocercospora musae]|uniref:Uncharacterized protein n=1 Tax=Pseudocercospora musae TaxID=113226 RepID=A0A139HFM8_9PEZI|nr:hypothetical protein AC579_1301 [Pseudocercospora musae]
MWLEKHRDALNYFHLTRKDAYFGTCTMMHARQGSPYGSVAWVTAIQAVISTVLLSQQSTWTMLNGRWSRSLASNFGNFKVSIERSIDAKLVASHSMLTQHPSFRASPIAFVASMSPACPARTSRMKDLRSRPPTLDILAHNGTWGAATSIDITWSNQDFTQAFLQDLKLPQHYQIFFLQHYSTLHTTMQHSITLFVWMASMVTASPVQPKPAPALQPRAAATNNIYKYLAYTTLPVASPTPVVPCSGYVEYAWHRHDKVLMRSTTSNDPLELLDGNEYLWTKVRRNHLLQHMGK